MAEPLERQTFVKTQEAWVKSGSEYRSPKIESKELLTLQNIV